MGRIFGVLLAAGLSAQSCAHSARVNRPPKAISLCTALQLNDVYEIMPVGGSGLGGLARGDTEDPEVAAAESRR